MTAIVAPGPPEHVTDATGDAGVGAGDAARDGSGEGGVGDDTGGDTTWRDAVGDGWWLAAGDSCAAGRGLAPHAITATAAIKTAASRRQVILLTETGLAAVGYGRWCRVGPGGLDPPTSRL